MPRRSETFGADSCGCGIKITYVSFGYDNEEVESVEVVRHCGESD